MSTGHVFYAFHEDIKLRSELQHVAVWLGGNGVAHINEVTLRRA